MSEFRRRLLNAATLKREPALPSGYIRLDWIVNETAGAYINTGVTANAQYSMEADVMLSFRSNNLPIFGTVDSRGGRFLFRGPNTSGSNWTIHYGPYNSYASASITPFGIGNSCITWNVFGIYKNVVKVNGVTVYTFNENTDTTSYNRTLYLLGINGLSDTQSHYCRGARIWDEIGTLVRNYVPAYQVSTAKYGMYDLVNGAFVSSANVNNQFSGPPLLSLPSGYIQQDYIEFSGAQYCDFSETVNAGDRFVTRFRFTDATTVQQRVFKTLDTVAFHLYINGSKSLAYNYGADARWVTLSQAVNAAYFCNIDFDGGNKTLKRLYASTSATAGLSSYTEASATKFRIGEHGGVYTRMQMMRFQKYTLGTLAHNLVPCLYNGIYGFYDTVTNTFITSDTSTPFGGGLLRNRRRMAVSV